MPAAVDVQVSLRPLSRARIVAGREPGEGIQHVQDVVQDEQPIPTAVLRARIKVRGIAEPVARAAIHRRSVYEVVQDTQDVIEVGHRGARQAVRQADVCVDLSLAARVFVPRDLVVTD